MKKRHQLIKQMVSQCHQYLAIGKSMIIMLVLLSSSYIMSQVPPPPPCRANGNASFGGAVGEGVFPSSGANLNPMIFNMQIPESSGDMTEILVLYIDTGAPGRTEINAQVDDSADAHRVAITNSNAFGYGSQINFPPGFEASYAIAVDVNFGGALYSIPSTGVIGDGDLNYETSVNSTLVTSSQQMYDFSLFYEDLGLTLGDAFQFVALYVSSNAYTSNEGYGEGILVSTAGSDSVSFTDSLTLPGCGQTLSNIQNSQARISAYYYNNQLFVTGVTDVATIRVFNMLGKQTYANAHRIQESEPIPLELTKNELQFIVIESGRKRQVLKVLPTL